MVPMRLLGSLTVIAVTALTPPAVAQTQPMPTARPALASLDVPPRRPAGGSTPFRQLVRDEAAKAGLPDALVDAVMSIESGYDPSVVGGVGEIGLMQVRPGTAAMLGFKGTARVSSPSPQIKHPLRCDLPRPGVAD